MTRSTLALACVAALVAGCGGPAEPAQPEASSRGAAMFEAARGRSDAAPSGQPGLRALSTPLPGGVVPAFDYNALVDMSTQAHVTIRQVHLDLPTLSAREGMAALAGQFEGAGLVASEVREENGTLVQSVWTPSSDGSRGMAVVDGGGTYVVIMGSDFEPGHGRRDDGFVAALRLQINSK
ncbi:hypothetical protein [Arenimonas caeni]|jgi:hypothetical protein|uniref:Uncharacterized protein n=1 Tax=Arenimonas caeni TaxID=2058085 RepID=A0A2P6M8Q6_9GAMM|nr:hypothetical protein [Arenimonas caeni]MDY0022885.1 hypothetical protein [Arenimonas caeni]PRH82375.1 hypothetical protein C6N40_07605 [Arenimonas caeni]